jgi:hypothetical protein
MQQQKQGQVLQGQQQQRAQKKKKKRKNVAGVVARPREKEAHAWGL